MHTYVELNLGENEYAEPIYQGESTTNVNAPKDRCCRRLFSGTRNKLTISLICILVSGIDLKWSQNRVKLMHGLPSIRYQAFSIIHLSWYSCRFDLSFYKITV